MNKLQHLQYLNFRKPSRYADNITAIQVKPSLDLNFARNKSLIDNVTGNNLVTFTRASGGTYTDSNGVLRTATTNLLLRSEEFDNATWGKADASILANATNGPTNQLTADKLQETATTAEHIIWQGRTGSSERVTFSIYAKQAERSRIRIGFSNFLNEAKGAVFDLATGTVIETDTAGTDYTNLGASIISVADGWYRCVFTAQKAAVNTTNNPFVTTILGTLRNFSGTLGSGVFLWGAQLEQSSTVGEYIPTTTMINSAPRFDHNPLTGECLGLLIEEQRTNSVVNSNSMTAVVTGSPGTLPTGWSAQANTDGWTREIVGSGSIGALNYVDIRFSGTPTGGQFSVVFQSQGVVAASNGQTWAASVYHQLVGGSLGNVVGYPAANLWSSTNSYLGGLNLAGSIIPSATLQRYTNSATISTASTAFISWGITFICTAGNTYDFTIRFAGPQLELGAFSTSFIPTTGTAATRSADVASITGTNFSSWYRQDEGTFYFEGSISQGLASFPWFYNVTDGTINNSIGVYQYTNGVYGSVTNGVAAIPDVPVYFSPVPGSLAKHAFAVKTSDTRAAYNGSLSSAQTSTVMPTVNTLSIGTRVIANRMTGTIRRLTYFPQRLSNANLQRMTQ